MTVHAAIASTKSHAALREQISLDGVWDFKLDDGAWRKATVPAPWQAEFADIRHTFGTGYYVRSFALPAEWKNREVVIRFGAVNYFAEVILNGAVIGTHEGGYLPFEFVLSGVTFEGENKLEVRATLPNSDEGAYPDYPFPEIPHGKQSWYGPLGGIWQSVVLEARDACHIGHAAIVADAGSGEVGVALEISGAAAGVVVGVSILDATGAVVTSGEAVVDGVTAGLSLTVGDVALWSPDAPNLYVAEISLSRDGAIVDVRRETFGFLTFETRDGKFFLNGEPFYMRGALDQDYYPVGICTPPSLAFLEDQLRKAKELGLNLLRCHIKVPDPRYYEVADRLGMLIWTEIPNIQTFTEKSAQRLRDTMSDILRRDGNHPSIVTWTIINEDWGTRLVENADHRQWLKDTYDWLKAVDPSRLVVDNSGCIPNFHVKTDINDYHYYRSVPERRAEWEKLTQEFADGADWTFSPHGDAERRGDEPLVVSEFGVWGLPNPAEVVDEAGNEPWWMETGPGWGDGAAYPHGIQNRFALYSLDKVFGSFENFIGAAQWYQFGNLKYEIESMRAHAPIVGYVITELTDVHWEANGLLDINRNPRAFHGRFAEINNDLVIVPQAERHAGYAGEALEIKLSVATGGESVPDGAVLSWSLGGVAGQVEVPATGGLAVVALGSISLTLPQALAGQRGVIDFRLHADGAELARNSLEVSVYAKRDLKGLPVVAVKDATLSAYVTALGYTLAQPGQAAVNVVRGLDAGDVEAMRHGARYLVLADGVVATNNNLRIDAGPREQPFMPIVDEVPGQPTGAEQQLPNIVLHKRQGTMWRGDWIANFSWLKRDGAFAAIPGGPLLDVSFDRVVPHHVMTGFRPFEYDGLIQAGLVVGWIHKPAVTIAERKVGKGGLVATTFRLMQDAPGADPVAAGLLDALIATAGKGLAK